MAMAGVPIPLLQVNESPPKYPTPLFWKLSFSDKLEKLHTVALKESFLGKLMSMAKTNASFCAGLGLELVTESYSAF